MVRVEGEARERADADAVDYLAHRLRAVRQLIAAELKGLVDSRGRLRVKPSVRDFCALLREEAELLGTDQSASAEDPDRIAFELLYQDLAGKTEQELVEEYQRLSRLLGEPDPGGDTCSNSSVPSTGPAPSSSSSSGIIQGD